ncbi:MAG TPA: hypothetical protein VM425_03590, partial [Myxococcota bacterium]|nr:hypothetical protein [Myxococcota bacterium]
TSAGLDNRSSTISSLRHKFRDVTQKIRQLLRVEISCVEIQASFSGITLDTYGLRPPPHFT